MILFSKSQMDAPYFLKFFIIRLFPGGWIMLKTLGAYAANP
jgi:hypothetical protein